MAYSDYGGYAYKNGERIEERSDAVLSPEGIKSTPGQWPGWTLEEGRSGGSYHVLLGDGPIFLSLYKQSSLGVHRLGETVDWEVAAGRDYPDAIRNWTQMYDHSQQPSKLLDVPIVQSYFDTGWFAGNGMPLELDIDGCKITAYFVDEENHYMFVRLEQPDGNIWTGFSGYGVGAGLEDADYGYSTDLQIERMNDLFKSESRLVGASLDDGESRGNGGR